MITKDQKQILEAVRDSLPEKRGDSRAAGIATDIDGVKHTLVIEENTSEEAVYNEALRNVRAIINEFLETVEGLTGKNPHEGKVYGGIRPKESK